VGPLREGWGGGEGAPSVGRQGAYRVALRGHLAWGQEGSTPFCSPQGGSFPAPPVYHLKHQLLACLRDDRKDTP